MFHSSSDSRKRSRGQPLAITDNENIGKVCIGTQSGSTFHHGDKKRTCETPHTNAAGNRCLPRSDWKDDCPTTEALAWKELFTHWLI